MSLFDEVKNKIEGHSVPAQFANMPKPIGVYKIPLTAIEEMNASYQREVARLDAEDLCAQSMMDKIWSD